MIIPYTSIINFSQLSSCRFSSFAGILFLTFPILLVYLPFLCGSFCLTRVVCQSVGRRLLTGARTIDGRKRHPFSGQPLIAYRISGEGGASWVLLYPWQDIGKSSLVQVWLQRPHSFHEFVCAMAVSCLEDTFFSHTFPVLWFLRSFCSFFHDVSWTLEGMTELSHLVLNTPPSKHSWTFGQLWASVLTTV